MNSVLRTLALFALLAVTNAQESISFKQEGCKLDKNTNFKPQYNNLNNKCFIKTDTGACRMQQESFHFDTITGKCVQDVYGGCGGCFAFNTMQECEGLCVKNIIQPVVKDKPKNQEPQNSCKVNKPKNLSAELKKLEDKCFIKTETGNCRMQQESFHFDTTTGKCVQDIFGGCPDGCSVFETIKDCESSCVKKSSQPVKKEDINGSFTQKDCKIEIPGVVFNPLAKFDNRCYIKTDTGLCRGNQKSFHFDPSKGKCVEDVYGGCGGCRAFNSMEECSSTCSTRKRGRFN
ncbi:hypothetical protein K502DRAFT_354436 [Neoconidiobolus thromboides FSU 785]|nr:hypothetical protein K502DRAFT_354436 [Neoconidiobolus thromboides FSU 785]